jgi:hypothetical protein
VAHLERWEPKSEGRVAKSDGWAAKLEGWADELVSRPFVTIAPWVRIQLTLKNLTYMGYISKEVACEIITL